MKPIILRRRKLGRTSCREIAKQSKTGIRSIRSDRRVPPETDMIFRWGCTSNIPDGVRVINRAEAIHQVSDKAGFRKVMDEHGLCPPTYVEGQDIPDAEFPLVARPRVHSRGRNLLIVDDPLTLGDLDGILGVGWYASPLIDKVAEYRVAVVQGRVAWVAQKTPGNPEDVAWNVAKGGRFDNVRWKEWPLRAVRLSIEAFNLSLLDFGGVDVMVDDNGEAYIIEINSAPSLTSPYRQECMAKCFDWIVRNGKERIPLVKKLGGYKKFIHPAVCEHAILAEKEK